MSTVEEVIVARRSVRRVKPDPICKEELKRILEQAAYAPYHNQVEPWSVTMIEDEEQKKFYVAAMYRSYRRLGVLENYTEEEILKKLEAYEKYYLGTPLHLIITADEYEREKEQFESIAAACAFIQNVQLLCWDKGIGTVWRTSPAIFDPVFAQDLNIAPGKKIVGTLHLGYPLEIPKAKERRPVEQWLDTLKIETTIN
jgi:nitroreductase